MRPLASNAADTAPALKVTGAYQGAAEIKGGSIAALEDGDVVRKGAKLGRTFTVKVFTRDEESVTKKLKLRAERRATRAASHSAADRPNAIAAAVGSPRARRGCTS